MGQLNSANREQGKLIVQLITLASDLPRWEDREAYDKYQEEVMQPVRDAIRAAGTGK
jgi:hypothetical protein